MFEPVPEPTESLRLLIRQSSLNSERLQLFLGQNIFPLQDDHLTTFVFHGEADGVWLHNWIHGGPGSLPFTHLAGSDLWHLSLELPERSRIEYKLEVESEGVRSLILDPLNPLRAHDPFGANSVCYGVGYSQPDWTRADPAVTPGKIEWLKVESRAFGQRREIGVYLPATFDASATYPVLLVNDGRDFMRYASLETVLDNLIHRAEIAPLVVALTEPVDRLREYAGDPRQARFLAEEVMPRLDERYPLAGEPAARGLMGASFGAVAALYTAWRYPNLFGRLLLQSGSFVASHGGRTGRGPEFRPVAAFTQLFRSSPRRVSEKIYLSCGLYESLVRPNRDLAPLLLAAGMEVRYSEARDGHNWENWRDGLREGLSYLFPNR